MKKYYFTRFSTWLALLCLGFMLGRLTANKLSKKVKTTNIATTEVKKQDVSVVQESKKDSTEVKETITRKISYGNNGKIKSETFVQEKIGTKTQIGTQSVKNDIVLDSSFSKSTSSTVTSYQSNWMVFGSYEFDKAELPRSFEMKKTEFGLGYRIIGNLSLIGSTNFCTYLKSGVSYSF